MSDLMEFAEFVKTLTDRELFELFECACACDDQESLVVLRSEMVTRPPTVLEKLALDNN